MSDFDENDIVPEAVSGDFDQEDIVAEAAPAREPNLVEQETPVEQVHDAMLGVVKPVAGIAAGGAAGHLTNNLLGWTADTAASVVGPLSKREINKISGDTERYKKARSFEDVLEEFRSLGERNREYGIRRAKEGRDSLKNLDPLPIQEYHKVLGNAAKADGFGKDLGAPIPEGHESKVLGQHLDSLEDLKKQVQTAEQMAATPHGLDELNQRHREATFNRKMGQLSTPIPENPKHQIVDDFNKSREIKKVEALEELLAKARGELPISAENRLEDVNYNYNINDDKINKLRDIDSSRDIQLDHEKNLVNDEYREKKHERQLQRAEEGVAKSQARIEEKAQKIEQKKQAFQEDMAGRQLKTNALRDVDTANAEARKQAQKDQLQFKKIQADEKSVLKQKLAHEKKLERLEKLKAKLEDATKAAKAAADSDMANLRGTPAPIAATDPQFFNNLEMDKDFVAPFEKAVQKGGTAAETITPSRMDMVIRQLREGDANYDKSGPVNNLYKQIARSNSDYLKDLDPSGYGAAMSDSARSINADNLWAKLGIQFDKDLKEVTESGDLTDGRTVLEQGGKERINNILLNAGTDKMSTEHGYMQEALKNAEMNGDILGNPDDVLKESEISALKHKVDNLKVGKDPTTFETIRAAQGDPSALGLKAFGTKAQEMYALAKGSGFGKGVQATGKFVLPGVGAYLGLTGAADAEDGGEAQMGELASDATLEAAALGASRLSQAAAGPAGIAAGLLSPSTAGDELGDKMLQAESDAYRNYKASKAHQDKMGQPKKSHEEFKNFVEQKPEQIANLLEAFKADTSAQPFIAPLEKAMNSDARTRSAVLFGLYQQPAFRAAIKAKGE